MSVEALSEKQKACLRGVVRGQTSKEIAYDLAISPATVDTYIKAAMARLGASNRRQAARILAERETAAGLPQNLGSLSETVAVEINASASPAQAEQPGTIRRVAAMLFSLPPVGGQENDLSKGERPIAIIRIAFVAALMLISIVTIALGIIKLLL